MCLSTIDPESEWGNYRVGYKVMKKTCEGLEPPMMGMGNIEQTIDTMIDHKRYMIKAESGNTYPTGFHCYTRLFPAQVDYIDYKICSIYPLAIVKVGLRNRVAQGWQKIYFNGAGSQLVPVVVCREIKLIEEVPYTEEKQCEVWNKVNPRF